MVEHKVAEHKISALVSRLLCDIMEPVRLVLSYGGDVNAPSDDSGRTALHMASHTGVFPIAELLLELGASPDAIDEYGITPLHEAAIESNLCIVELLIEYGADVNIRDFNGMTPLFWAATSGSLSVVKALVGAGADPNAESFAGTAESIARDYGFTDIVDFLTMDGEITADEINDAFDEASIEDANTNLDAAKIWWDRYNEGGFRC